MQALVNATVHTGFDETGAVAGDAAVLIDGGRIAGVVQRSAVPPGVPHHDLGGGILAPGFIDLQVKGGGGLLFNDRPTVATVQRIAEAHRRFGTTGLLPTLMTDSRSNRATAIATIGYAVGKRVPGVLGLHLEGPHIAMAERGLHHPDHIAPPEGDDLVLLAGASGYPTLVTLAPETVPPATIRAMAGAGLVLSAGHSAARLAEARAGFAAGIRIVTPLYNAMSQLGPREPGLVGAALDDDEVWCGIIVDGHHLHDVSVRLAWRAKPRGKLFLVTDAMPPVGAEGKDRTGFTLHGEPVRVEDGRCVTADGTPAGSVLDMATAVRNCVERIGIPLDEALRMAAAYPADALGIAHERGRIRTGMAADLVHLDDRLMPRATWIGGKMAPC